MASTLAKGFSGLNSLITELDPNIIPAAETENLSSADAASSKTEEATSRPRVYQPASKPSSGNKNWFWWGAGILFCVWLVSKSDDHSQRSSNYQNSYTSPATSSYPPLRSKPSPSYHAQTYSGPAESAPPLFNSQPTFQGSAPTPSIVYEPDVAAPPSAIPKSASFDCSKAISSLEKLICSNTELSSLDGQVGVIYTTLKNAVAGKKDLRNALLAEQKKFLKDRSEVCKIPDRDFVSDNGAVPKINCLKGLYNLRLSTLQNYVNIAVNDAGPSTNINTETRNAIEVAIKNFFKIYKSNGKTGVLIFLDGECAAQTVMEEPQAIYCMAFDTMASGLLSAYEQKANYPLTPQFQKDSYNARMRRRLLNAGVDENEKQTNIIYGIQAEVNKTLEQMEADGKTGSDK